MLYLTLTLETPDLLPKDLGIDWHLSEANTLPSPLTPITEKEYLARISQGLPKGMIYTQVYEPGKNHAGPLWDAQIQIYHSAVYLHLYRYWIVEGKQDYVHQYFRVGCVHDFQISTPEMHHHIHTCKLCGFVDETWSD